MSELDLHTAIADAILRDLEDRAGFGNVLERCDVGTRFEIRDTIAEIITRGLSRQATPSANMDEVRR